MLHKKTEVRERIRGGGKGIFATELIKNDEIVWKMDDNEKILTKKQALNLPPYELSLVCQYRNKYILNRDNSQYMNHSCDPALWFLDDDTMIARRDIKPGEEITYDYSATEISPIYEDNWDCQCGSKNCRGRISPLDCLTEEFQKLHQNHLPIATTAYIQKQKNKEKKSPHLITLSFFKNTGQISY